MTTALHIKTDNITAFMKEAESYPRISHERERELYNLMHGTDTVAAEAAREELICANLRLVVKISHCFKRYAPFSDLVSEGCIGLVTAADKFDPEKCEKFSIVAALWIKQAQRKFILGHTRTIRLPDGAAQLASRIARVRHAYEAEFAELPTDEYVAEQLGVTTRRVEGAAVAEISIASMNEKINEDSDTTFEDMIGETLENEEDCYSDKEECMHDIHSLISRMNDMDRFLITRSHGIDCEAVPIELLSQETGMCQRCIRGRLYSIYQHLNEVLRDKGYDY